MGVTAIVGAQYGSEGKGVIVNALADRFDIAVRTGGPNAGHSFRRDGVLYKMRQVPVPWTNPDCELILGAGAVVDTGVLLEELLETGVCEDRIKIDHQAVFITHEDREAEEDSALTKMGSTLEGVGAARIKKIQRDVDAQSPLARARWSPTYDTVELLWQRLNQGSHVLLEGTQGSGLSLHHGMWPYVTSSDTNAAQLMADAGIAPGWLTHSLLVARTYPIRVGGPSGPMPGGEISFEDIPGDVTPERTTVTNKIRRISGWDSRVVDRAVVLNDPCGIALTFTDYLDPHIRGTTDPDEVWASRIIADFIWSLERETRVPVVMAGTGGPGFSVVRMRPCKHGTQWP